MAVRGQRAWLLAPVCALLVACVSNGTRTEPRTEGSQPPAGYPFEDVTEDAGVVVEETRSWGATWTDFDSNGYPDLFISRHGFAPYLFANGGDDGYSSLEIRDVFYPERVDRHACAWGEADGDGVPDLYCTQGVNAGTGRRPNLLYVQTEDGFAERAADFGVGDEFGRGRTTNWLDYDVDGDLDIFVGNKHREGFGNVLLRNDGGTFTPLDAGLGLEMWSISSAWSDWDRDGDPDLLVVQYPPHPTRAFENVGGGFERVNIEGVTGRVFVSATWGDFDSDGWPDLHAVGKEASVVFHNRAGEFALFNRVETREGRMSAWFDVENDGDLDLYVLQGGPGDFQEGDAVNLPDFLLVNEGDEFRLEREPSIAGDPDDNPDSVVVADHDRDGSLDIFINNGYSHWKGRPTLYENRAASGNWVALELHGDPTNPWGFGSRVTVVTDEATQRREITDGFNYRGQSEVGYVHFGIGEADSGSARIVWPDGVRDCVSLEANTSAEVVKGDHPCA